MDRIETLKAAAEIRKLTITAMESAGYGHIGGSMSVCDMLAVLYTDLMDVDPKNPKKVDRDFLVLSKGHSGPALYAALSYKGFFPAEELKTLNKPGTKLPSHCDRLKTAGIDISTGSLGQGLSIGAGVALGKKIGNIKGTVYVIVGDGELQEGQNWEAVQFIAHQNLDNIVIIVDDNGRQLDGYTNSVCNPFNFAEKFASFGIKFTREANGHEVTEIYDSLKAARDFKGSSAVVLHTEKGYGCNFSETVVSNHYMVFNAEQAENARKEIDRRFASACANIRK